VGGGAGGVELAFALERRLPGGRISIVEASEGLLLGVPAGLRRRVERRALARGIELRLGKSVSAVEKGVLRLCDGERVAFDVLIWAAGARGVSAPAASDLPVDVRGFILVETPLQVVEQPGVFAAGDCAALREFPETPKAGVYAVRQGPVLASNLRALLDGRPLRRYRPQRDFLTLLNLADGTAAGSKWGVSFEGRWVMTLKDRIDRRFVARYRSGAAS
jgi:selenide,water dikinase